ncbi:hypothetical protein C0V97_05175 [Asaia sp. W19]|uniref:TetR/AcrR family transcriptional regulator n=1 Tax=unclassified Asaia TaxID=2685023 RepID=UPI000F8E58FC|nr:TetR/AcrR family transcriptional regulator [Asaia sp. W19]RUT26700.1 hypothetical protein C0V97_05175 [Asaia sp. W19]
MKPPLPSTKSRILEEARLFANEVGFDRLTTRELAERCAINEGNLYYHFRTKTQLIEALFAAFDTEVRRLFDSLPVAPDRPSRAELLKSIARGVDLLRAWCALSWHYRALMRDGNALFRLAPELQKPAVSLNAVLVERVTEVIKEMRRMKALSIDEAAIPGLVANIFIISTHWLGYVIHQIGVSDPDETYLEWGFSQIFALIAPYRTWMTRLAMRLHTRSFAFRP